MNKKFSTLLAAFLVAGGLGSSAFAQTVPVKSSEYFQLELNGKYLGVGEDAVRDSLALIDLNDEEFDSLNGLNKTLWRVSVETNKDANGFITSTKYYLVNKVNGGIALTYADASEDLSSYYAPGAVVSAGKWALNSGEVSGYKDGTVTFADNTLSLGTAANNNSYDAATKEAVAYKLADINGIIKLAKGTADASKCITMNQVKTAPVSYHEDFDSNDLSFTIQKYTKDAVDLTADWLNDMANDAFTLSFNKDVSSSVENPFSLSSLKAVEDPLYSAAVYVWGSKQDDGTYPTGTYNRYLADANSIVEDLNDIKQLAASYVKEIKVALDAEVTPSTTPGADNSILALAPNKSDIETLDEDLNDLLILKEDNDTDADNNLVLKLLDASALSYGSDGKISEAKEKADELDEALKALNERVDELVKSTSEAISKYDAAVKNFATEIYRPDPSVTLADDDYKDYMIDKKTPAAVLTEISDSFATVQAGYLTGLSNAQPTIQKSVQLTTSGDNYVLAVIGQADTYITVDTSYVAEREKYLGVRTMKLNRIGLDASGDRTDKEDEIESYVLVPNVGDLAKTAIFSMTVDPTTTKGDLISIYAAYAPEPTEDGKGGNNPKWFKDYTDAGDYFVENQRVVIRTLSGLRVLSVTVDNKEQATDVVNNTKITFLEPELATKINNGDIYFIVKKTVADAKTYNKYVVVDPLTRQYDYAREAYLNVPATQWLVVKNNDTYELNNRDVAKQYGLGTGKIYVVDEDNMIYTTNERDTFQLVAADAAKEGHLGYKYISEEIQKISDFALSAVNYANMETPYYLTFNANEDSILTATSNKEEALALIPMIVDGKQVTEEYAMNDENLTKQFYQLIAKDGKDTLYLTVAEGTNELIVTKVAPEVSETKDDRCFLQFRNINDEPNAYEVLIGKLTPGIDFEDFETSDFNVIYKLSYNQDGEAVAVYSTTASSFVYDLVDNSTDIYKNFGFEGSTKVIISLNGDAESKVTKIGPFATVKRTGLDETIDADYSLIMDTAYVDHKDNIRYAYYITKPIVAADTAWNAEKFYMVSYADSLARENDTIKYSQDNLTRIGFVAAKRLGTDSLAITKAVGAAATDTLNVTDKLGVTNATFAFAIDENNEEAYRIEVAPAKYVSYLNGILVEGAKEQAQLFNVNATDLTPTDNEEISVEAGVQVIGGKGAVTVQGAAGKTVTVYNFQGRALASTTLTSDNQTIAVPAGLVAVSVEGEPEAISVVVK